MNGKRIDALARLLARGGTRRGTAGLLAGAGITAARGWLGASPAAAGCKKAGQTCHKAGDCCTHRCKGGKCRCKHFGATCASAMSCCQYPGPATVCAGIDKPQCLSPGTRCCAIVGGRCGQTCNCCGSAVCGFGGSPDGVCCLPNGVACLLDHSCCSGYCKSGTCSCRPLQAACDPALNAGQCCVDLAYGQCAAIDGCGLAGDRCCHGAGGPCSSSCDCCGFLSCDAGTCQ